MTYVSLQAGNVIFADIPTDIQQDQAPAINALFQAPDISEVVLPAGVIWIERTVEVPANKTLRLETGTTLRALDTFAIVDGKNHGVLLSGNRAQIIGGCVDMNKRGIGGGTANRYNGVTVLNGARDCVRTDIVVMNCTGYAVYDSGTDDRLTPPSSLNTNVLTLNSQIHFEPQGADGTIYIACHARDGDGDIACLGWFHPLVGSRNIRWIACTGYGNASTGMEATANIADLENIQFIDGSIELINEGGVAFTLTAGQNSVNGLLVSGSRLVTNNGVAAVLNKATASFCQTLFQGGYGVSQNDSYIDYNACDIAASLPTTGSPLAVGITVTTGRANWTGGSITVAGPNGSKPFQGRVLFSGGTRTSPQWPSIPVVLQEAYGVATLQGVDSTHCTAEIYLPLAQTNLSKCFLTTSIRKIDNAAPNASGSTITWTAIASGHLRVFVDGANLAGSGYELRYHFVENE